jgi:hypothetical protein
MRVNLWAFGWFPAVDRFRDGDDEEAGGEEADEGEE